MKKKVIESNNADFINNEDDSFVFQKKESALWKCAFIVFVGSLVLITISAVSHINASGEDSGIFLSSPDYALAETYQENQNSQETISALLEENQRLKKEIEIQRINSQNMDGIIAQRKQIEILTSCRNLFSDGKYEEAYNLYLTIDSSLLTEIFMEEYNNLLSGLKVKLRL